MMKAEISFDLVMEEDMDFVEGTYRLSGGKWQVYIFGERSGIAKQEIKFAKWESGVTGVTVLFPTPARFNKTSVLQTLSQVLGVTEWTEVRGPDSMQLR